MNTLYYGDNLKILREYIKDETVDLVYLDPPFNSKRNYNQIYNNIGSEDRAESGVWIRGRGTTTLQCFDNDNSVHGAVIALKRLEIADALFAYSSMTMIADHRISDVDTNGIPLMAYAD